MGLGSRRSSTSSTPTAPRPGEELSWLGGPSDADMLYRSLRFCAERSYPGVVIVHCEDIDLIVHLEAQVKAAGRRDIRGLKRRASEHRRIDAGGARSGNREGLEHFLPVLMTSGVATGRLSMEDVVRVGAENTARVFGLYPRKGVLAPGADADVVIVDPDLEATVDAAFYHCLCEVSIYRGQKFRGLAWTTIVRGRVMMEARQTVGAPGWGRHVARGGPEGTA